MAYKNKFKVMVDISHEMKSELIEAIYKHYGFTHFTQFTMEYSPFFYNELAYNRLIPDTHQLYHIYNTYGPGSSHIQHFNNLVFYLPNSVEPYFRFTRNVFFRSAKQEASFFIYCLFTNIYFKNPLYIEK